MSRIAILAAAAALAHAQKSTRIVAIGDGAETRHTLAGDVRAFGESVTRLGSETRQAAQAAQKLTAALQTDEDRARLAAAAAKRARKALQLPKD